MVTMPAMMAAVPPAIAPMVSAPMRGRLNTFFGKAFGICLQLFEIGQDAGLRLRAYGRDARLRSDLW